MDNLKRKIEALIFTSEIPVSKKDISSFLSITPQEAQSQIDDLIDRLDFPHYIFTLKASVELCIARDATRDKPHGKDAATVVHKKSTEFTYGIEIDATKSLDECIDKILSHLPKK